jgi:predicted transcriptional regulator
MARPLSVTKEEVEKMIDLYRNKEPIYSIAREVKRDHTTVNKYINTAIRMGIVEKHHFNRKQKPSEELLRSIFIKEEG